MTVAEETLQGHSEETKTPRRRRSKIKGGEEAFEKVMEEERRRQGGREGGEELGKQVDYPECLSAAGGGLCCCSESDFLFEFDGALNSPTHLPEVH